MIWFTKNQAIVDSVFNPFWISSACPSQDVTVARRTAADRSATKPQFLSNGYSSIIRNQRIKLFLFDGGLLWLPPTACPLSSPPLTQTCLLHVLTSPLSTLYITTNYRCNSRDLKSLFHCWFIHAFLSAVTPWGYSAGVHENNADSRWVMHFC